MKFYLPINCMSIHDKTFIAFNHIKRFSYIQTIDKKSPVREKFGGSNRTLENYFGSEFIRVGLVVYK